MPVTITAGITFSGGGLTMSPPPSTIPTAGWYGVPSNPSVGYMSTLQRITYATDTETASIRGQLSVQRTQLGAVSTLTYGWWGGGYAGGVGSFSLVDRTTFATDTATNVARGPLTTILTTQAASSDNTTYGWFGGGAIGQNGTRISTVTRIQYSNDTAVSTDRGPLSSVRRHLVATGNTSYGWFGGGYGYTDTAYYYSTVDRITYATDTATASVRGPLSLALFYSAATGNSTDGWFAGGYTTGYPLRSTVNRITYATDTATASVRGPLSVAKGQGNATGDPTYGWYAAGTTVQRITYATDTNTATERGPMALTIYNGGTNGACAGVQ